MPKSAKSQHNSLLQKNSVEFGTNFTRARKKNTPALLARWNIFPSLAHVSRSAQNSLEICLNGNCHSKNTKIARGSSYGVILKIVDSYLL